MSLPCMYTFLRLDGASIHDGVILHGAGVGCIYKAMVVFRQPIFEFSPMFSQFAEFSDTRYYILKRLLFEPTTAPAKHR